MPRSQSEIMIEISQWRQRILELETELASLEPTLSNRSGFSLREYKRYGRQMILREIGLPGQLELKRASILVIGAGGLGCPVLLYLASAGVGTITILDHDQVELSNLHRQVLHTEARIGMNKAESARVGLQSLNSDITIHAHSLAFTPDLFSLSSLSTPESIRNPAFTLILDCTDNPATRYFLNSYASAHQIPLVSGGAVRTDGVVGVYGLRLRPATLSDSIGTIGFGPCYACLFPVPPVPDVPISDEQKALQGTGACSDEGVLGVLCGAVGLTMCSEAIRVILGTAKPTLHLISPLSATPCRTMKVRARREACPACSSARVDWDTSLATLYSTGIWPGWEDPLCEVPGVGERGGENRTSVQEFARRRTGACVIDLRSEAEFGICSLEGSINIPFPRFLRDPMSSIAVARSDPICSSTLPTSPVYFLCRRGNDSFLAATALRSRQPDNGQSPSQISDVLGGLTAWSRDIDPTFPVY